MPLSGSPQAIWPPAPPCPKARPLVVRPKPRMARFSSSPATTTPSARFTGFPWSRSTWKSFVRGVVQYSIVSAFMMRLPFAATPPLINGW